MRPYGELQFSCRQQQHSEFEVFRNNNLKCIYFFMEDHMVTELKKNYEKSKNTEAVVQRCF